MALGPVHDTAPHLVVSAGRPQGSRRLRRRGPRSLAAVARRCVPPTPRQRFVANDACNLASAGPSGEAAVGAERVGTPMVSPDHGDEPRARAVCDNIRGRQADQPGPCEAGPSIFGNFSILHCNIRGFLSHRAELEGHLRLLPEAPALICINETFLDDSVDDGVVFLGGYKLVARRDRHDGRFGGGIICFLRPTLFLHK